MGLSSCGVLIVRLKMAPEVQDITYTQGQKKKKNFRAKNGTFTAWCKNYLLSELLILPTIHSVQVEDFSSYSAVWKILTLQAHPIKGTVQIMWLSPIVVSLGNYHPSHFLCGCASHLASKLGFRNSWRTLWKLHPFIIEPLPIQTHNAKFSKIICGNWKKVSTKHWNTSIFVF